MNRTHARELWTRIASGDLERPQDPYDRDDLFQWIRNVARMVLEADDEPSATQRPYGITAAVGLAGRLDPDADLRDALERFVEFDDLTHPGPPARGKERALLIAFARSIRPGWVQFDDDTVYKRVRRLLD